jgi:hexosaminidase
MRYMVWPRGFAIAEALWTPKANMNWNNFIPRVENHFQRFDAAGKKYAPSMYEPVVKAKKEPTGKLLLDFDVEVPGVNVYYSFDNSFPDNYYPAYTGKPLLVPVDATMLRVVSFKGDKQVGRAMNFPIAELKKRAK